MINERALRRALILIALAALAGGLAAAFAGHSALARWIWAAGAIPVAASLTVSIIRDLRAGRMGVDAVALLSMLGALALGETLAGIVVAVMYAGGGALEDFAVGRAERDLKSLVDRAPRVAHRKIAGAIKDAPVGEIAIGDALLVQAGEIVPVDGLITSSSATLDESAVTGESIPVTRRAGEAIRSGAVNAGETFEMQAMAAAGDSTYAGIIKMVTAAQTAKAPFMRMADRFAMLLLPVTLLAAGAAWFFSHDPIRGLAVLVVATPCPLILAAPVAFIAGAARAARRGILIKGGGPLEALARTHTVMFDKTGTLTVGGARLVAIETAPGEDPDETLRLAASLEQASQHVVAGAIVAAARARGLDLEIPEKARETMGSGLEGVIGGRMVKVGSYHLVHGGGAPEAWAGRALRRASWRSALSVFVSVDGRAAGALLLADELRRESPRAVQALRAAGVARIVMVTGDRADTAETIGAALDLDEVLADRAPADKVAAVASEQRAYPTLMVGDGINDAPALAAADVGIAMGARGASASSEAADVVILVDRLDRVPDAVKIAHRTRGIALQSIVVGMSLSGVAMGAAAFGWLSPVAGALTQEAIDVAVILNALRALSPGRARRRMAIPAAATQDLHQDHQKLAASLDRLRQIADALDDADGEKAVAYIAEANRVVEKDIAVHERDDETSVYPRLVKYLASDNGLFAMSRAHREILHLSKLLGRLADGLDPLEADRYLIRDAQRIIESIESLARMHNAQEEDIYERAVDWRSEADSQEERRPGAMSGRDEALQGASNGRTFWRSVAAAFAVLAAAGGGWFAWSSHRAAAPHYLTQTLDRGSIVRTVTASGIVNPVAVAPFGARAAGVIQAVYCDLNAKVTAGQVCAKIAPRPYQIAVEQAEANLAAAQARLESSEADLSQARAALERDEALARRRTVSRKALNASRKAYAQAQERMTLNEASVATLRAALHGPKVSLANTDVISPVDGLLVSRNAEIGQTAGVDSNTRPLFRVADLAMVEVNASVGAKEIGALKPGDEVAFTVASLPDRQFAGEAAEVRRTSDAAPAIDVVIRAPNRDLALTPGMAATIRIVAGRRDDVLRAPLRALRFAPAGSASRSSGASPIGPQVWVLRDGKPTAIPIEIGLDDGDNAEIVKGDLRPGDEVIVEEK